MYAIFERMKNFWLSNSITKDANLELFMEKDQRYFSCVLEYIGFYKNLFFENCKFNAAIFGALGVKITDVTLFEHELYCRFDMQSTELFYDDKTRRKERIKLIKENTNFLLSHKQILIDEDYFLWMEMAQDKDLAISFRNDKLMEKWITIIEKKSEKSNKDNKFLLNSLRFFEKLHWIDIESEEDLSFRLRFSDENDKKTLSLLKYLSKYSLISKDNGNYHLK